MGTADSKLVSRFLIKPNESHGVEQLCLREEASRVSYCAFSMKPRNFKLIVCVSAVGWDLKPGLLISKECVYCVKLPNFPVSSVWNKGWKNGNIKE